MISPTEFFSNSRLCRPAGALFSAVLFAACGATDPSAESPLPLIEHVGISIEPLDQATMTAGDITFAAGETFIPFGKVLEGANGLKRTPELTFFVPAGTLVRAPISGVVSQVDGLYSLDYRIVLQQEGSDWEVGVEHVIDPLVEVGDVVEAGQIIATATPEQTPFGPIAFTELAVWLPAESDGEMLKMCPYLAFEEQLQREFAIQINQLVVSWEAQRGQDVFKEETWTQPGCVIDQMTEADVLNPD